MGKLYRFMSLIFLLCINECLANAAVIQPIERTVGKLHISIDPRTELLSAIQLLSNYSIIDRDLPYSRELMDYFESFSSQKAVQMTDSLEQKHGFGYDAPIGFMLYLSQPPELKQQIEYSDYLSGRSGKGNNLELYRESISQFAEASNFEAFWNSKISFYNQILDMTISDMEEKDLVKILENYYNETQGSYNIVILPAVGGGGFASRMSRPDGKNDIYNCVSATDMKNAIPYINWDNMIHYVWHEFGHSYVNPLTEKHADKVASVSKLFEPIKDVMSRQAYGSWYYCINEHIIRAVHVRLDEQYLDTQKSKDRLAKELKNRFIYIEPLVEKLKDFEKQRDEKGITFSEFYPELLTMLDSLQKIEYWKQVNMNFTGPVAEIIRSKSVIIYPTRDSDKEALKKVQDYALLYFNTYAKGGILLADTTALKTDLSEYGIIALGTIESNQFLKQYTHSFPFKIENQTIYADKEYTDKDIRFITCVSNPFNPKKGMVIYTALSNEVIQDFGDNFDIDTDYLLFKDTETFINSGYYDKTKKWSF